MLKKTLAISFLVVLALTSAACSTGGSVNKNNAPSGLIFFYGDSCPHCKIVEQYMSDNQVDEVLTINKLEVYNNRDNAALMTERAKACGLDSKSLGVPLLVDGNKCFMGDQEAIDYLKSKLNQ